jgi:hypothetical protein
VSPHDIALAGDHIVVVDQAASSKLPVRLYRVANAVSHELLPVEKWEIAGAVMRDDLLGANRVVAAGHYAFVACSANENFKLGFIDIRDPDNPRHLKTLPFADVHATGLAIEGSVLFAAGGRAVQAIDVSDPAEPKTLTVLEFSESVLPHHRDNLHDLVYADGHLFLTAQNDNALLIVRVNDERIRERMRVPLATK